MNYIGNAVKFTKNGTIEVLVDYEKDGFSPILGTIKFNVTDSGVGISMED